MNWYVYEIAPIDTRWEELHTVREIHEKLASRESLDGGETFTLASFTDAFELAQARAGQKGWDGDFRGEPCVFWIPFNENFHYGFVFKQDNNGTTYVVSPIELPHLEED